MVKNPPEGNQRVIPYIMYADAPSAITFLTGAFGFTERFRMPGDGPGGHGPQEVSAHGVVGAR